MANCRMFSGATGSNATPPPDRRAFTSSGSVRAPRPSEVCREWGSASTRRRRCGFRGCRRSPSRRGRRTRFLRGPGPRSPRRSSRSRRVRSPCRMGPQRASPTSSWPGLCSRPSWLTVHEPVVGRQAGRRRVVAEVVVRHSDRAVRGHGDRRRECLVAGTRSIWIFEDHVVPLSSDCENAMPACSFARGGPLKLPSCQTAYARPGVAPAAMSGMMSPCARHGRCPGPRRRRCRRRSP